MAINIEYPFNGNPKGELEYLRDIAGIIHRFFNSKKGIVEKDVCELHSSLSALMNIMSYARTKTDD